jgi:TPR repeat protein
MKSSRGLAVVLICVVVVAAAAITWRLVEAKAAQRKLAEDAKACRVRAEGGDAKAQYELGARYYEGKGVAQDYGEAVRWYRKAADQGSARGQYAVGFMYEGVRVSHKTSRKRLPGIANPRIREMRELNALSATPTP